MPELAFEVATSGRAALSQGALVWEMEHRIKNHLQLLSSYVRLASQQPGMTLQAFSLDLSAKLTAIAGVHEALQAASRGVEVVAAAPFLESVCRPFANGPHVLRLHCPSDLRLDADQLAPVGMIVSEAVANAFKHAFADQMRGEVAVALAASGGDLELQVRDNGCGLIGRHWPCKRRQRSCFVVGRESAGSLDVHGDLPISSVLSARVRAVFMAATLAS